MKKRMLALACALFLSTFQPIKPNSLAYLATTWHTAQLATGGFGAFILAHILYGLKIGDEKKGGLKRPTAKSQIAQLSLALTAIAIGSYTTGATGLSGLMDDLA